MSTAKLIGQETAKARLIQFNKERIERAYPLMSEFEKQVKLAETTDNFYTDYSAKKLYKEYDQTFTEIETKWTADDQLTFQAMNGTLIGNPDVEYSAALMG